AGVDIIATGLTNISVRIHAANNIGFESNGSGWHFTSVDPAPAGTSLDAKSAYNISAYFSRNKIRVSWYDNNAAINVSSSGYSATKYDVYMGQSNSGPWVLVGSVDAESRPMDLYITEYKYKTDYYFRIIAICNSNLPTQSGEKIAAVADSLKLTIGDAPTAEAKNILSAHSILSSPRYVSATNTVEFSLLDNLASNTKAAAIQYYVVLRDANKAVIASTFLLSSMSITQAVLPLDDLVLTPKAKYTVEVYGVVGKTVGTAKVTGNFSINENYPAATLKLSGKATINEASIIVTDKTISNDKFYYVQYTNIADAKGKPDWNTASVEKLTAYDDVKTNGGVPYKLDTNLDPNTQYYVRIVTSDVEVAIGTDVHNWIAGNFTGLNDWSEATKVVFSKEIKIKTAAVPLAVTGKSGLSLDSVFNLTLKTTGQTMLSAKDADKMFVGTNAPLKNATFTYKLLVSLDSKVDKVTGKLLGSTEIDLNTDASNGNIDITIENFTAKNKPTIKDGQYTLEYALTGTDGIFKKLGVTVANVSSLKNLNFQLITVVEYGTLDSRTYFESVTKTSKIALPKWFV
ncbi:MAG: hypothetical protein LBK82_12060, partial [Planctomycetaceae bacterium]|nr:hypothetical protein [Planctomycetaceae bacterium]